MSGRQKLVRFRIDDLRKGETKGEIAFETLYDFEYNSPGNFVYSPDGRYLYGSSYYTGASNLFRYDFETKKMDVISNAETGLFRPMPLADGSLIAFEYTSKGFVPARVPTKALEDVSAVKYFGQATVNKYPELKSWKLPPPSTVNSENLITRAGAYNPIQNIQLISAYPIVQGYRDTAGVGMRAEFADRLAPGGNQCGCQLFARSEFALERARAPFVRRASVEMEADGLLQLRRLLRSVRPHQAKPQGRIAEAGAFAIPDLRYVRARSRSIGAWPVTPISTRCRSIRMYPPTMLEICWMRTSG